MGVDFIVYVERYLTRIGNNLQRLAVSHAVPSGSQEVIAAFNFISELSNLKIIFEIIIRQGQ
jgi:hypothetical protein